MASDGWRRWWAPLACVAAGAGVGVVIGGGLAPRVYDWTTEWNIDAPLAGVYEAMSRSEDFFEGSRAFVEKREPRWKGQ